MNENTMLVLDVVIVAGALASAMAWLKNTIHGKTNYKQDAITWFLLIAMILIMMSCTTAQLARAGSTIAGIVCDNAEQIFDDDRTVVGVRFIAAVLGQDCADGFVVTVPAGRPRAVDVATELRMGDAVEVDGEILPVVESSGGAMEIRAYRIRRIE